MPLGCAASRQAGSAGRLKRATCGVDKPEAEQKRPLKSQGFRMQVCLPQEKSRSLIKENRTPRRGKEKQAQGNIHYDICRRLTGNQISILCHIKTQGRAEFFPAGCQSKLDRRHSLLTYSANIFEAPDVSHAMPHTDRDH